MNRANQLILLRHAEKGITPFEDPHLTPKGFQQAENLLNEVRHQRLPTPTQLWASTKIRTTQTLQPTAQHFHLRTETTNLLNLRQSNESPSQFRERIEFFYKKMTLATAENLTASSRHFVCTHYDWIEEAMTLINCDNDLNTFEFSHWAPAQYIVFEIPSSLSEPWKFIRLGTSATDSTGSSTGDLI
jgi:phosphohistidine phosphatase SixA